MEQKFKQLRKQLTSLGYRQPLVCEAVPLVDKLLNDLIQTTANLQKYMKLSKNAIEERDNLQLGAEPYKCDNAKLVKECNDLHLTFLQYRERNEKIQADLKSRIKELEGDAALWQFDREKFKKEIRELRFECAAKSEKLLELGNKEYRSTYKPLKSVSTSALRSKPIIKSYKSDINATMALSDEKITNLTREIKRMKDEQLKMTETNESYKRQLSSRDKEIQRLTALLEGGRPQEAVNRECCYKGVDSQIKSMQDEIDLLKREKCGLESRLKESLEKQHEAMKRALSLCERNKQLEKELRDIDQMALAVEAEANSTAKSNAEKVSRLQDSLHTTVLQLQNLEKEAVELRRQKEEIKGDLNAVNLEKKHLQGVLETAIDEKRKLVDRVNQFTIIENDLNKEIDRLVQTSAAQKQKIAEVECRLVSEKVRSSMDISPQTVTSQRSVGGHGTVRSYVSSSAQSPKKKKTYIKSPSKKSKKHSTKSGKPSSGFHSDIVEEVSRDSSPESVRRGSVSDRSKKGCEDCIEKLKMLIDQEIKHKQIEVDESKMEILTQERDYYMKEYQRLTEQMKNIPSKPDNEAENVRMLREKESQIFQLQRELDSRILEKEQVIKNLQEENKNLAQERYNLMSRPQTDMESLSLRSVVKRVERERDLLKGDVQRLEEERDTIRQRLKTSTENYVHEHDRLEKDLAAAEDQIKRLEQERRELMKSEGSRRYTVGNLKEECDALKDQYKKCTEELTHVRTMYTQLKVLHEQTDRALADSQNQVLQLQSELSNIKDRARTLDKDRSGMDTELSTLRSDLMIMKQNLSRLDQDKDELLIALDDKTEKVAKLEQELKEKEQEIYNLQKTNAELKQQMTSTTDIAASKEYVVKNLNAEVSNLKNELDAALKLKDSALKENKRLQDDLASCISDCRRTNNELELAKRQVEDLKRQLQHYVAEVKRTEDLISQKEVERSELLDQFRSLSHEATVLESNNHTLETEATQTKVQLSVALEHAIDLERKLESQEDLVRVYLNQISDLTSQIASLEMRMQQKMHDQEAAERELANLKELCVKLDNQKDNLSRDLKQRAAVEPQLEQELDILRKEKNTLRENLNQCRFNVENLEQLLTQSRQEAVEQRLTNQELLEEITRLKKKMKETEQRLPLELRNIRPPTSSTSIYKSNSINKFESGRIGSKDRVSRSRSVPQLSPSLSARDSTGKNSDVEHHAFESPASMNSDLIREFPFAAPATFRAALQELENTPKTATSSSQTLPMILDQESTKRIQASETPRLKPTKSLEEQPRQSIQQHVILPTIYEKKLSEVRKESAEHANKQSDDESTSYKTRYDNQEYRKESISEATFKLENTTSNQKDVKNKYEDQIKMKVDAKCSCNKLTPKGKESQSEKAFSGDRESTEDGEIREEEKQTEEKEPARKSKKSTAKHKQKEQDTKKSTSSESESSEETKGAEEESEEEKAKDEAHSEFDSKKSTTSNLEEEGEEEEEEEEEEEKQKSTGKTKMQSKLESKKLPASDKDAPQLGEKAFTGREIRKEKQSASDQQSKRTPSKTKDTPSKKKKQFCQEVSTCCLCHRCPVIRENAVLNCKCWSLGEQSNTEIFCPYFERKSGKVVCVPPGGKFKTRRK